MIDSYLHPISTFYSLFELIFHNENLSFLAAFVVWATYISLTRVILFLEKEQSCQLFLIRYCADALRFFIAFNIWYSLFFSIIAIVFYIDEFQPYRQFEFYEQLVISAEFIFYGMAAGQVAGWSVHYLIAKYLEPKVSRWLHQLTDKADEAASISDVRNMAEIMPSIKNINLMKMFIKALANGVFFMGVSQFKTAVVTDIHRIRSSHILIIGPTGTGKGIMAQNFMTQAVMNGEAVYMFNPKNDEYLAPVMARICAESNKPFINIDLTAPMAQFNPFFGCTSAQLFELLEVVCNLEAQGTDADFYRLGDREAARLISVLADSGTVCFQSLMDKADAILSREVIESANGFFKKINELAAVESINTLCQGVDLAQMLRTGGCVNFIGAMRGEAFMAVQKMVALRVFQLIENRAADQDLHAYVLLDEMKYMSSKTIVNLFGTVRDKHCTLLLTTQSRADLRGVQGMDPDESQSSIETNCQIKWAYRTKCPETSEWLAAQTGTIIATKKRTASERNEANQEISAGDNMIDEVERYLFDVNTIQNLPDACALLLQNGEEAQLALTKPLLFENLTKPNIQPVATYMADSPLLRNDDQPTADDNKEDPFL